MNLRKRFANCTDKVVINIDWNVVGKKCCIQTAGIIACLSIVDIALNTAAVALSRRVLAGGEEELGDYLAFLRGGCSKDPLDLLKGAGVDMTCPEPVATTLKRFGDLTEELDRLL